MTRVFAKSDGSQDDFDFAAKTWVPIAEKCLVEGKTGWRMCWTGWSRTIKVSGEKLVYKV